MVGCCAEVVGPPEEPKLNLGCRNETKPKSELGQEPRPTLTD